METNGVTEGDRVEARGVPITLADGRSVRLRFGAKALRYLEREYGSLKAFQEEAKKGNEGRAVTAVLDAIIAGLLHESLGTVDEVENLLDERRLTTDYADAFNKAWDEAQPPEESGPADVDQTTATGESLGETSTTSQQSSLEELTTSSGT